MSVEFKQDIQAPVIRTNFDAVKEDLLSEIAKYKNLVVNIDSYPFCKSRQSDLSKMRTYIDDVRKAVKKAVLAPYDDFETQCKELQGLILQVETPLREGVAYFDEQRRTEQFAIAGRIVKEEIEASGLRPKFAGQVQMLKEYGNLSATENDVRKSVKAQVLGLVGAQAKEDEIVDILKEAVDSKNKSLKTKMVYEDFLKYIDKGMQPAQILNMINDQAERLYAAENPAPVEEAPVVQIVIENPSQVVSAPLSAMPDDEDDCDMAYAVIRVVGRIDQISRLIEHTRNSGMTCEVKEKGMI